MLTWSVFVAAVETAPFGNHLVRDDRTGRFQYRVGRGQAVGPGLAVINFTTEHPNHI